MVLITIGFILEIVTGAWLNINKLVALGANLPLRWVMETNGYWRFVTSMFLHGDGTLGGDLLHFAMNLWAVYQLGTLFEIMFGTRRFLLTYFITGIVASAVSSYHMPLLGESVGASGAIFGILGAFIFSVRQSPRWRHDPMTRRLIPQLLFWIVLNLGVLGWLPQIDNSAHIGGLVCGLLLGFLPHRVPPPPPGSGVIDVQGYPT